MGAMFREVVRRLSKSPERDRLEGTIQAAWIAFDDQIHKSGAPTLTAPWARKASRCLADASQCLARGRVQQGWIAVTAAQRALLSDPNEFDQLQRVAIALRREAAKLTGWRAKAIDDLICDSKGTLLPTLKEEPGRVIDALALRDDQFHTTYFKIGLRRRHLRLVSLILWGGIVLSIGLSFLCMLPVPFDHPTTLAAVVLFGALGAGVSVGQELLAAEVSAKVPEQNMRAFVVWMRPAIGSTAAIVSLVLFFANDALKVFTWSTTSNNSFDVILAVAFAAGFSERFIVGALGRITSATKKDDSN